ncbi:MAG: ABC transporter substrate-binding protein [Actinomycetota bacterium]|nr:ABC transporter substrate-binding protein [Actinomycetota bacterium]
MVLKDRWIARLVALAAVMLIAFAACGEEAPEEDGTEPGGGAPAVSTLEEGILTVGSDIPFPPFEFRKDGKLQGLDIDLVNEIAARLELEPKVVDTGFDTIFSQLAGGRFDVVVAASTITPEREKEVNFSDPYYNNQQGLTINATERSDIKSLDDLKEGDVVGVQSGTTGKAFAEENVPDGVEIRSFPEGPDPFTALEAGELDAVMHDEPTAIAQVEQREGLEFVETFDTGEVYGIAVDPENEELLDAVNEILAEIIEDGTYEEIYSKYPDLPPGGNVAATG